MTHSSLDIGIFYTFNFDEVTIVLCSLLTGHSFSFSSSAKLHFT